ncbi:MAG TPA: cell division protein FtsL [Vicinamibacterales bacterium]
MDFEHAIKMDVRNNPIVREIDRARQRELWRMVLICLGLVAVILFSVWQRFSVMRVGAEIERMQRELREEREVNRQLALEVETLSSPRRIEELATKAGMVQPTQASTLILQRTTTSPPPPPSVVAAREPGAAREGRP